MANHKRQQSAEAESQGNTRQDRNLQVSGGGTLTWDSGTGTLSWSSTLFVSLGGATVHTLASTSVVVGTSAGSTLYVDADRAGGGGALPPGVGVTVSDASFRSDNRIALGTRSPDGKFYWRNGTVMFDGDSKTFGALNSVTDRNDVVASGAALEAVGFSFVAGSGQLAVYVGGLLQTVNVEYVETGTTQVTFQAGYIPTAGELVSFVNIVGGQGPAATGTVSLQDAWAVDNTVDVTTGDEVFLYETSGAGAFAVHDAAPPAIPNLLINGSGNILINSGDAGYTLRDDLGTDYWGMLPLDDGAGSLVFFNSGSTEGLALSKTTSLLEFGTYTGAFPGGTWAGEGGIRWMTDAGTLNAGSATTIAIGAGLTLLGVTIAVFDSGTSRWILHEVASGSLSTRTFFVTYDDVSGDLSISGLVDGTGAPGSSVDGEAYQITIFYQS